jgi:hypothetical protein
VLLEEGVLKRVKGSLSLAGVQVSFLVHATEDEDRIVEAVEAGLGVERGLFAVSVLEGHHGNPIKRYEARLKGREAKRFLERLAEGIGGSVRDRLTLGLQDYLDDKGTLYLRFDKQALVEGRLELGGEGIRVRVKPKGGRRELAEQGFRALLGVGC